MNLQSGSVLEGFQAVASGMPERPWSDAAFDTKMAECLAYGMRAPLEISVSDYSVRRVVDTLNAPSGRPV